MHNTTTGRNEDLGHPGPDDPDPSGFRGYAILELLGHRRLAGYVTEEEIASQPMLRIDIPWFDAEGHALDVGSTQYYAPQSLYSLLPCTARVALEIARAGMPQPVQQWDVRALADEIRREVKAEIQHEVAREYRAELERQQRRTISAPIDDEADDFEGAPF